jgi:hypothetical protein
MGTYCLFTKYEIVRLSKRKQETIGIFVLQHVRPESIPSKDILDRRFSVLRLLPNTLCPVFVCPVFRCPVFARSLYYFQLVLKKLTYFIPIEKNSIVI